LFATPLLIDEGDTGAVEKAARAFVVGTYV
jgi:hypothetical protein